MSNLSPNNRIINSINRSRYIDKLRGNIGVIKENNRTPIHHKIIDTYEDLTSNVPTRYIIVFLSLMVLISVLLYYFKPKFILKNKVPDNQLKISSNKTNKLNDKVVSYWKLIIYSLIITIIVYSILYFLRTKSSYIGKLFEHND
jgi:membrane-anchored glycerophosphoryl diester phosphodiesterase (GDPDase)